MSEKKCKILNEKIEEKMLNQEENRQKQIKIKSYVCSPDEKKVESIGMYIWKKLWEE